MEDPPALALQHDHQRVCLAWTERCTAGRAVIGEQSELADEPLDLSS